MHISLIRHIFAAFMLRRLPYVDIRHMPLFAMLFATRCRRFFDAHADAL